MRPVFFETVPLMKPRMLWFCQLVALAILGDGGSVLATQKFNDHGALATLAQFRL